MILFIQTVYWYPVEWDYQTISFIIRSLFIQLFIYVQQQYNNNSPIMLGSTLAESGCGTIPVQMIELHQVVDRQHDCSSDSFYQILNSVAKLSSAYLSNWSLNLTSCHLKFRNVINMRYF